MPITSRSMRVLSGALVLLLMAGCGSTQDREDPQPNIQFTSAIDALASLRISGDEVEPYEDFNSMQKTADVTAWASMASIEGVRTVGSSSNAGDKAYYLQVELKIERATPLTPSVTVEFLLPSTTPEQAQQNADAFSRTLPSDPMLMFLRAKQGPAEEGLHRLINSKALWVDDANGPLAPLAEEGAAQEPLYQKVFQDKGSVASIADQLLP